MKTLGNIALAIVGFAIGVVMLYQWSKKKINDSTYWTKMGRNYL